MGWGPRPSRVNRESSAVSEVIVSQSATTEGVPPLASPPRAGGTGRRATRNFLFLALPEVVNRTARFAANVLLARALALHAYSVVNVGIAAAGVAMTLTTLGLPEVGARDIAVDHSKAGWLAGKVVAARGTLLGLVLLIAVSTSLLIDSGSALVVLLAGAVALLPTVSADWILRGLERMRQLGTATALGGVTVLGGAALIAVTAKSSIGALGAFALGEGVVAGLCWSAVRPVKISLGFGGLRPLLRRSWPVALSTIAFQTYYAGLDTLIIATTRSTNEAGLYSAAYRVFLTLNIVSLYAAYALLPLLAQARHAHEDDRADRILSRSFLPLAGYGLIVVGVAEIANHQILRLLFGSRFGSMGHVWVVLCLGLMWYTVGYPAGYAFIASGRNRQYLAGAACAAVLNVVVNLSIIPVLGALGAALATTISFSVSSVVWLWMHPPLRRQMLRLVGLLTSMSCAAAIALVVKALALPIGFATATLGLALVLAAVSSWTSRTPANEDGLS